jgi:lipoate-protein ligase A
MRIIDYSFEKPTENLALDELLLDWAEAGKGGEVLRFWESPRPFVVLGVSQILRNEVFEKNCLDDHMLIMRRCSAGGCVMQGPGCLNYTLVFSKSRPEIETLRGSYCHIIGQISGALKEHGILAHHKGISDIALGGKKVSGSAQKRRRNFIMHHGTLLYSFDPDLLERYLREPADRPQYRGDRSHRKFVRELPLTAADLRHAVKQAFELDGAMSRLTRWELDAVRALAEEKYAARAWVWRR